MFEGFEGWRATATQAMADYAASRRRIEQLEAESASLLARAIGACRWPAGVPEPSRFDGYSAEHINGQAFGEDLAGELALANKTTIGAARYLVCDITDLAYRLPRCWGKVKSGEAPLWQARRVAQEAVGLDDRCWPQVDEAAAPALGAVNASRLTRITAAAVARVDPDRSRRKAGTSTRHVHTGGDCLDPLTGWLSARLDRGDALSLEETIRLGAETLAGNGDTGSLDERRAKALGLLGNPAAAVQLFGIPSTRGMNPAPSHEAEASAFIAHTKKLQTAFTPRTQIYVHLYAETLTDPDAIARVEGIGPLLTSQVADITKASRVRVTPVIHLGANTMPVDSYEIPDRIREHVLTRSPFDVFPWSNTESRHLDLDHTIPYQPGQPAQTRPDNLGPLSRRAHRLKTHAGWQLTQPRPGVFIWQTPAGQHAQTDHTGTHTPSPRSIDR